MNHAAGIIALVGLAVGFYACAHAIQPAPIAVTPATYTCPKLANPCNRVNCNRVNTKVIA